ncbi:MAG: hypothetical protein K9G62_06730 [Alphaproteobacteria bacterium]|nr:hypothetical protein [Alphaproteobacteria bacterium]
MSITDLLQGEHDNTRENIVPRIVTNVIKPELKDAMGLLKRAGIHRIGYDVATPEEEGDPYTVDIRRREFSWLNPFVYLIPNMPLPYQDRMIEIAPIADKDLNLQVSVYEGGVDIRHPDSGKLKHKGTQNLDTNGLSSTFESAITSLLTPQERQKLTNYARREREESRLKDHQPGNGEIVPMQFL